MPLDTRRENDLAALARAVDSNTLAVWLVNRHHPYGTVSTVGTWHASMTELPGLTLAAVNEAFQRSDDLTGR
ncbi:hypothetical protein [Sphingomonas melonis]|uniref:Histidinol-phosphate/aromatic aminotransferase/cobyric acid decarboxylase-like protein n=1 Tax=Sphingomonas melonis TaxID=152682 RepID=A0A7Y9K249_9SPHN|nr:hypothetical protein [Sphingomonas melonis]NYD89045.1 histidinol-phosphate/aromatic aminotransferase/cobyric acid decarboxylase-like protein [Sphingomonas melonis]